MNKNQELVKNTIIIFIGKACTQFITILLLPLYTKYLISSEFGIVDLVITYISLFVPILSLDLEMAAFRFLVDKRKDIEESKRIITTILFTLTVIAIFCTILFIPLSFFLNIKYKYLIYIVIIMSYFSQYFIQVSRGLGKNINYSISCCINGITTVFLNVIFIPVLKMEADGMLLSMIIANIMTISYLFYSLDLKKYISFNAIRLNYLKEILSYSIPLIPNGISWWIVNASDRTIISIMLSVSANGIYAVSNKFSSLFIGVFNVFQLSWAESVSLHVNENDSNRFISNVINIVLKAFTCLGMLLIAVMPIVFRLFIDDKYNAALDNVPILIVAMIFNVAVGLYSAIYIAKKMTKQVMNTSIVSAIVNIIINLLLISYIGLYAASISTLIAYAVMAIYRHFDIKKMIDIHLDRKYMFKSVILMIVIFALFYQKNVYCTIMMILIALVECLLNFKYILKLVKLK